MKNAAHPLHDYLIRPLSVSRVRPPLLKQDSYRKSWSCSDAVQGSSVLGEETSLKAGPDVVHPLCQQTVRTSSGRSAGRPEEQAGNRGDQLQADQTSTQLLTGLALLLSGGRGS